jgi:hypothetical protein
MDEESKTKQLKTLYEYSSNFLDKYINPYLMNDGVLKLNEYFTEEKFREFYNEPTNNIEDIIKTKIILIDDYFKNHAIKLYFYYLIKYSLDYLMSYYKNWFPFHIFFNRLKYCSSCFFIQTCRAFVKH